MFYIENTGTTIFINRELGLLTDYTLKFKNKDEFNIEYSTILNPTITNSRYSTFVLDLLLKTGFYKFYIYDDSGLLIYNDMCLVELEDEKVIVVDTADKKIIID